DLASGIELTHNMIHEHIILSQTQSLPDGTGDAGQLTRLLPLLARLLVLDDAYVQIGVIGQHRAREHPSIRRENPDSRAVQPGRFSRHGLLLPFRAPIACPPAIRAPPPVESRPPPVRGGRGAAVVT